MEILKADPKAKKKLAWMILGIAIVGVLVLQLLKSICRTSGRPL